MVNEQMETSVGGVYAAGDVCHADWGAGRSKHWFQMRLWTQARQMGMYAGQCMHADWQSGEKKDLDFCFEMFAHSTKFFGFKAGFISVQHLQGFSPVLPFGYLHFIHASTNATDDHKYSPLPSADFDSSEVLVSFSAFIFSETWSF